MNCNVKNWSSKIEIHDDLCLSTVQSMHRLAMRCSRIRELAKLAQFISLFSIIDYNRLYCSVNENLFNFLLHQIRCFVLRKPPNWTAKQETAASILIGNLANFGITWKQLMLLPVFIYSVRLVLLMAILMANRCLDCQLDNVNIRLLRKSNVWAAMFFQYSFRHVETLVSAEVLSWSSKACLPALPRRQIAICFIQFLSSSVITPNFDFSSFLLGPLMALLWVN